MTRLTPLLGSLKKFTIDFASPRENLEATPITLPTSEPATPQVSYTVQSTDLPTITPRPYSCKYIACVYAAGKFTTAGTLYWRMKKNGVSVKNGSASVAANTYYTVNAFFLDVAVGDVLEIALWSSVSDSNWDYNAIFVYITRFFPFPLLNYKQILAKVKIYNEDAFYPTLTLGNPTRWNPNYPLQGHIQNSTGSAWSISTTSTITFDYYVPHATYGLWRVWYHGDQSNADNASVQTDATYRPKYFSNRIRMFTECRPLRIE